MCPEFAHNKPCPRPGHCIYRHYIAKKDKKIVLRKKPCTFYSLGTCKKGSACLYSHDGPVNKLPSCKPHVCVVSCVSFFTHFSRDTHILSHNTHTHSRYPYTFRVNLQLRNFWPKCLATVSSLLSARQAPGSLLSSTPSQTICGMALWTI